MYRSIAYESELCCMARNFSKLLKIAYKFSEKPAARSPSPSCDGRRGNRGAICTPSTRPSSPPCCPRSWRTRLRRPPLPWPVSASNSNLPRHPRRRFHRLLILPPPLILISISTRRQRRTWLAWPAFIRWRRPTTASAAAVTITEAAAAAQTTLAVAIKPTVIYRL